MQGWPGEPSVSIARRELEAARIAILAQHTEFGTGRPGAPLIDFSRRASRRISTAISKLGMAPRP
jgi:hypothetical protein